jgi:hypothetical protein
MSKIFINENSQALAPSRPQLAQVPDDLRAHVDRGRGRRLVRSAIPTSQHNPSAVLAGTIVLTAIAFALFMWGKSILITAAVVLFVALFWRAPIVALGFIALVLLAVGR